MSITDIIPVPDLEPINPFTIVRKARESRQRLTDAIQDQADAIAALSITINERVS